MKNRAEKNLSPIDIENIIDKIKSLNQGEFDKMIIDKSQIIQRCDYYYVNYKAVSANRQSLNLTFPIYGQLADNMSEFEGGDAKHGELAYFPSDKILNTLSDKFDISPVSDSLSSPSNFNFPLDENGDSVSHQQRNYFIADRTFKEQCDECSGNKLIKVGRFKRGPSGVAYFMRKLDMIDIFGKWCEDYKVASGEDSDLCMTVWNENYDILIDERVLIKHKGKATAKSKLNDWKKLYSKNGKQYRKKWFFQHYFPYLARITQKIELLITNR